jgi:molecular chaperone DnaK (HSP70)/Tfp pilus assembly protein PilZ
VRWKRLFGGKDKDKPKQDDAVGPRRRGAERFPLPTSLTARCSTWPKLVELMGGDVSAGGLYIPTDNPAKVGDRVDIDLTLPDGAVLPVKATIVAVLGATQAEALNKPRGVGVKLDKLEGADLVRFELILDAARAAAPRPDPAPAKPKAPPPSPGAPAVHARSTRIVGIDLGTSYTSVSAARDRKIVIMPFEDGLRAMPSVVSFPSRDQVLVGSAARARLGVDPAHTIMSPKRILGRRADDREAEAFMAQAAYKTGVGPDGLILVDMYGEPIAITQVCAHLLTAARKAAESYLGEWVSRAVVTVPVTFDDARIRLLKRAGQLAKLDIVATIDEPSSAALANRFMPGFGGVVGVYDFGGGTFDFTVVDVSKGDFTVLATAGDSWLGGDDFDLAIAEVVANRVWAEHYVDLRKQAVEWQRLLMACEQAKRRLSEADDTILALPQILRTAQGLIDLEFRVDRPMLETICEGIIDKSIQTCRDALSLVDMQVSDLSAIYLSGGTTYIPAVRARLERETGVPIRTGVPAEHAVCLGAGIHAAQLQLAGHTTL